MSPVARINGKCNNTHDPSGIPFPVGTQYPQNAVHDMQNILQTFYILFIIWRRAWEWNNVLQ